LKASLRLFAPLLLAGIVAIRGAGRPEASDVTGYQPVLQSDDTLRVRLAGHRTRAGRAVRAMGVVVPGYLSARGLPPIHGRFTVTDSGLIFRSAAGVRATFPLVGPVRHARGRRWRASAVSLAYIDDTGGRPTYVFRVDAGVFETETPGPLLDLASHPMWLDSLPATDWVRDQPLVRRGDSTALWTTARAIMRGAYADTLYALFGAPRSKVGLIGWRGRKAGRLGEYIGRRDSLALDPGRMMGTEQLRHTLAHELGHRWQFRAPGQLATLWRGVDAMRDPKRYGYGSPSEHQAEAIAFAVDFLQTTTTTSDPDTALTLLNHYELLVPGTRIMVRYLALQPVYSRHPLRGVLTTGSTSQNLVFGSTARRPRISP
jgi:hypothetical protein